MKDFDCCGVNGYRDFNVSMISANATNVDDVSLPATCCPEFSGKNSTDVKNPTDVCPYEQAEKERAKGCFDQILLYLDDNLAIFIGIASAVIVIELLGIYCALILHNSIDPMNTAE